MSHENEMYEFVCDVFREKITPLVELIEKEFQSLREQVNEQKEINFKLISGLYDASTSHKRGAYSQRLGSYDEDLGPLDEFHKDTFGKPFRDSLLDQLLEKEYEGDEFDNFVKSSISGAREKFGKYLPQKSVEIEVETVPEEKVEEKTSEESEKPRDAVSEMIGLLRGKK